MEVFINDTIRSAGAAARPDLIDPIWEYDHGVGKSITGGMVYRGIYLPSLSGKLQDERLEAAYQKYAHRQRQKSLMLVNTADVLLKVMTLLKVTCYLDSEESAEGEMGGGSGSGTNGQSDFSTKAFLFILSDELQILYE